MIERLSAEELRRHKGISFTGITTVFICYDSHGRIFMTKRSPLTRDEHGRWDFGGGGLKHGETVEGNMKRELKEEYGAEPIKTDFIGYFDSFRQTDDGQPTHWLAMCFAVKVDRDEVAIGEPEMVDDSGWFDLEDLPTPHHSQTPNFLSLYAGRLKEIIAANS